MTWQRSLNILFSYRESKMEEKFKEHILNVNRYENTVS